MPTKNGSAAKIAAAIVLALGIPAGGVIGFAKLQSDVEWACKNHEQLRVKHEVDLANCEAKFNALKATLDTISSNGTRNTAKLDMLVEMVRDMKGVPR